MSVLVRGMEMPESCYRCPMTNEGFYLCLAVDPYKYLENESELRRASYCPLVSVPPHGDLIDRDEFIFNMSECVATIGQLLNAPVIIKAEGKDNG